VFWCVHATISDSDIFNRCACDLLLPTLTYNRGIVSVFFQQIYGFCGESCMMLQWQVIVYTYLFLSLFVNTVLILIIFCVNRTANTSVDVSGGILTYLLSRTSEKCGASVFVAAECTESALTSCEVDPPYIITDDSDSSSVCKLVQHLLVAPRERIC